MNELKPATPHMILLDKAITKAVANSWDMFGELPFKYIGGGEWRVIDKGDEHQTPLLMIVGAAPDDQSSGYRNFYEVEQIVFNHGFAKALWSGYKCDCSLKDDVYAGTHPETCALGKNKDPMGMLQTLVVAEDLFRQLGFMI